MDSTLLNNVKNIIAKSNSNTTSLNLEVIHVITWKDLIIDLTRSEVFFKHSISSGLFGTSALNNQKLIGKIHFR